jgi:hypothetical protein
MQGIMHEAANQNALRPRRFAVPGSWCAELLPRHPYQAAYTPDLPVIGFAFDGQVGVHAFGSDRKAAFRARANGLAYVPAGCDVYSQSKHGGEYLKITVEKQQHGEPWPWPRRFSDVIDPVAIGAAQRLRRLLPSPNIPGTGQPATEPLLSPDCGRTASRGVWTRGPRGFVGQRVEPGSLGARPAGPFFYPRRPVARSRLTASALLDAPSSDGGRGGTKPNGFE